MIAFVAFAVVGWFLVGLEPLPENVTVERDGQAVVMSLQDAQEQELLSEADGLLYRTTPFVIERPIRKGLRFAVGMQISPEYISLLLGLMIYTSSFIAEIVRAGIQAVPSGQIEASRALGLSQSQTLRMVILPQALRVIIPPLGNQFLNLAKNSSLAIAIGFADFYQVSTTVMNQSGQSVTGMSIVMLTYLTISLTISATANWVNRRFQLVTR
jgi:general L-amino acid transport system permease protein